MPDVSDASALYEAYYFAHDCGRPYGRSDDWLSFFDAIAAGLIRDLAPSTMLDAGCAMGLLVECFRARGVEAYGIDVSQSSIAQVHEPVRPYCAVASICEPLPRRYDLIVCIEVL